MQSMQGQCSMPCTLHKGQGQDEHAPGLLPSSPGPVRSSWYSCRSRCQSARLDLMPSCGSQAGRLSTWSPSISTAMVPEPSL